MIFEKQENKLVKAPNIWDINELELEQLIVSNIDEVNNILDEHIFGEELLLIDKEVKTKSKKRADILALDHNGSAVIIELKKERGRLGVETQALQYLADFSNYKGEDFIKKFCNGIDRDIIENFMDVEIKNINSQSRIILMARYFDSTLYSMGKWLSDNGVSFKCISYTPLKFENREYINFSVDFELLSNKTIYKLEFTNAEERKPKNFWHIIENFKEGDLSDSEWWSYLIENNIITANFDNSEGDKGERILKKYIRGDKIFAYKSGKGIIGYGIIENPKYKLIKRGDKDDVMNGYHMHRLQCKWKYVVEDLNKAIKPGVLKDKYKIHHPFMTSSEIKNGDINLLLNDFIKICKNE